MGYGVIKAHGNITEIIVFDFFDMRKLKDHFLKIQKVYEQTVYLLEKYCPDELAIESPFYGKNIQSMLKLARSQGAAISAGLNHKIPIFEYAPMKVKMAVTGRGNASKDQVAQVLQHIFKTDLLSHKADATDALAVALCHLNQNQAIPGKSKSKGWSTFVSQNSDRIRR